MSYIYEYFTSFLLAFIVAFSATPIAKKLAFKIGAVDIPKDGRRMHSRAIPKLGGLAIISGFVITMFFNIVTSVLGNNYLIRPTHRLLGLLAGIGIILIMGLIDDVKGMRARYKLIFQVAAAIIIVYSGSTIQNISNPFSDSGMVTFSPYVYYPLTVLWIVGVTNAVNLIDGLDGLAAGVSSIASLSLFCVSVISNRWDMAVITAALAGATMGFLPFNFNPARIFMADTGSNFLGFTLAVISIQGTLKSYAAIAIAIPVLVLGLPLFDTLFAIIRRLLRGKNIMEADRGHLHHRLIDMGLSHKQSVLIMYIVSAALGLVAIVLADKGVLSAIFIVIFISVFIIGGARYMSEINERYDGAEAPKADEAANTESTGEGETTTEIEENAH